MSRELTGAYFRARLRSQPPTETSSFVISRRDELLRLSRARVFESAGFKKLLSLAPVSNSVSACEFCATSTKKQDARTCTICTRTMCGNCISVFTGFLHSAQPGPVQLPVCASCARFVKQTAHRLVQRTTDAEKSLIDKYEQSKDLIVGLRQKKSNLVGVQLIPEMKDLVAEIEAAYRRDKEQLKRQAASLGKLELRGAAKLVRDNVVRWINEM